MQVYGLPRHMRKDLSVMQLARTAKMRAVDVSAFGYLGVDDIGSCGNS